MYEHTIISVLFISLVIDTITIMNAATNIIITGVVSVFKSSLLDARDESEPSRNAYIKYAVMKNINAYITVETGIVSISDIPSGRDFIDIVFIDTSAVPIITTSWVSPASPEPNTLPNIKCVGFAHVISISIARVFLKAPPILILDEATSALDSVTERRIQESLDLLSHGRTCIVIAHRLSTIRNADQIAVIENQGISEIGTRKELLARGGVYAALERAQEIGDLPVQN